MARLHLIFFLMFLQIALSSGWGAHRLSAALRLSINAHVSTAIQASRAGYVGGVLGLVFVHLALVGHLAAGIYCAGSAGGS